MPGTGGILQGPSGKKSCVGARRESAKQSARAGISHTKTSKATTTHKSIQGAPPHRCTHLESLENQEDLHSVDCDANEPLHDPGEKTHPSMRTQTQHQTEERNYVKSLFTIQTHESKVENEAVYFSNEHITEEPTTVAVSGRSPLGTNQQTFAET